MLNYIRNKQINHVKFKNAHIYIQPFRKYSLITRNIIKIKSLHSKSSACDICFYVESTDNILQYLDFLWHQPSQ